MNKFDPGDREEPTPRPASGRRSGLLSGPAIMRRQGEGRNKEGPARGKNPDQGLILLSIGAFLLASGILVASFSAVQSRARLLQQYQLEQSLAQMVTGIQFNADIELSEAGGDLPFQITAFAIYDQSGYALLSRGEAPEHVAVHTGEPGEQLISTEDGGGLVYIRRLPPVFLNGRSIASRPRESTDFLQTPGFQDMQAAPSSNIASGRLPATVLIGAQPLEGETVRPSHWVSFLFTELIIAALIILFASLAIKNRAYKRALAEQQNLVTLGEAARTISHEIKNPLSAIGLRLTILDRQLPPEAGEDLEIIREEVDRLDRLASKIGQFLKYPAGTPEAIDLRSFVHGLIRAFGSRVVETDAGGEPAMVMMDPDHLRSIVENVLVNAWEAGSPEPLEISIQKRKQRWLLSVTDRGPGIDPQVGDSIFKPFFTTKARGSGIGLAIARRFAEAAGGTLSWRPNPDGGTIMTLSLPETK